MPGTSDHVVNTGAQCCPYMQIKGTAWGEHGIATTQQVSFFVYICLRFFRERYTHTLEKTKQNNTK